MTLAAAGRERERERERGEGEGGGREEFVKLRSFVMKPPSKMIHSLDLGSVINRFTAAKSINCSRRG
jgi:hypothetical protein